ncbi:MAG: hypothetical protein A4E71_00534 [Smithella sp. PtaU1.Bin162]|nr:MAG: hypothetical protein A4E71_00534 [Smithella sp. PtaU1.Bin162]
METEKINIGCRAKEDFANFLETAEIKDIFPSRVKGKFLLIKYTNDASRETDFLRYVFENLPLYSLSKEERDSLEPNTILRLWKTAVDRFVSNSKTGEFGEIILFHLLELFEGAVQIVNKMALKTSGEMHAHGADAIHFGLDGSLKTLYLGESKTYQSFGDALNKALSDINNYHKNGGRQFDIKLVSGNLPEDIPEETRKMIKDYLNPCKSDLFDFTEAHAVFIGYQYDSLQSIEQNHRGVELINKALELYRESIKQYLADIESKFKEFPDLANKNFLFFIIPFKDLKGSREKFAKAVENGKKVDI